MNAISRCHPVAMTIVIGSFVLAAGCGALDRQAQESSSESEALSLALDNCAQKSVPDAQLEGAFGPLTSPTIYNNPACPKSWVVDASPFRHDFRYVVRWADEWNRNKEQCVGGVLNIRLLSKLFAFPTEFGKFSLPLRWNDDFGTCFYPDFGINFSDTVNDTSSVTIVWHDYRERSLPLEGFPLEYIGLSPFKIVAQALTPRGTTQPLTVQAHILTF